MNSSLHHVRFSLRSCLMASIGIAITLMAIFHQLTLHPSDLLVGVHADGQNDLSAFLRYRDEAIRLCNSSGEIARWNPQFQLGTLILGNPQSAQFYPPNWIAWVFGSANVISWVMIGHLWWAGLGTFLLLRTVGLRNMPAFCGAIASSTMPYAVAHLAEGHYSQLSVFAWLPWICWRFEVFVNSSGERWKWLPVCVSLACFGGHIQELYYLMLLLSGCVLIQANRIRSANKSQAINLIVKWVLVALLSGLIVAIDVLPIVSNVANTARSGQLPVAIAGDGLTLAHLKLLWNPMSFGGPENLSAPTGFYWTKLLYFGVVNLGLAILLILIARDKSGVGRETSTGDGHYSPPVRRWAVLCFICIVFAFGSKTPLFGAAYNCIPMVGSFRVPTRVLFIASMLVAWLAAVAIHKLHGGAFSKNPLKRLGCYVLAIVGMIELAWHANRVVATVPDNAHRKSSQVTEFMQNLDNERVLASQAVLTDYETLVNGVNRARGYEPVLATRYAMILDALQRQSANKDFTGFSETTLGELNPNLLDLMGIRYFATSQPSDETSETNADDAPKRHDKPPSVNGWSLVSEGTISPPTTLRNKSRRQLAFRIYENADRMPRAFVIGKTKLLDKARNQVEQLAVHDCRAALLISQDVLPAGPRTEFAAASIESYQANRVVIQARTTAPGYLVLTDLYHPGWQAKVDSQPCRIIPAYVAFRAVPLTKPGEHTIEFEFVTPGFYRGAQLSTLGCILLFVLGIRSKLRRTRPSV